MHLYHSFSSKIGTSRNLDLNEKLHCCFINDVDGGLGVSRITTNTAEAHTLP